ncbi:hypothetical protein P7K49_021540 [Saguinus oedipus]|uniref:Quinone oxidoreductase n=1 Tax=Saguinus oedipus TaxID=9490 RepID=A0ABQ9UVB4_SAGOE|nr:hypothetical protein P7K49_021540 [Saguinus oedipus]
MATRQKLMRAVRVFEFGGPEVLKLQLDVAVPIPKDSQVLIKVHACGVNPVETYIRSGTYSRKPLLPYTPGSDVAGVIEAVGDNASAFKKGDRTFTSSTISGGYAEYAFAADHTVYKLPEKLDFKQGAAIALIHSARMKAGESVLVHGASGGVGLAACQIARAYGLKVLGTAGTEEGQKVVLQNGAHEVFNHREVNYIDKIKTYVGEKGIDVIIEMLANVNLSKELSLLSQGGRVIVVGNRGTIEINPRDVMTKESSIIGVTFFATTKEEFQQYAAALQAGMEIGLTQFRHLSHAATNFFTSKTLGNSPPQCLPPSTHPLNCGQTAHIDRHTKIPIPPHPQRATAQALLLQSEFLRGMTLDRLFRSQVPLVTELPILQQPYYAGLKDFLGLQGPLQSVSLYHVVRNRSLRGGQRAYSKLVKKPVVQPIEKQEPKDPQASEERNTEPPSSEQLEPTITFLFTLLNTSEPTEPQDPESDSEIQEYWFPDQEGWGPQRTTKEIRHLQNDCMRENNSHPTCGFAGTGRLVTLVPSGYRTRWLMQEVGGGAAWNKSLGAEVEGVSLNPRLRESLKATQAHNLALVEKLQNLVSP